MVVRQKMYAPPFCIATIDPSIVTKLLKKLSSGLPERQIPATSGDPKSVDSEAMFQVRVTNPVRSSWKVSAKVSILLLSGVSRPLANASVVA